MSTKLIKNSKLTIYWYSLLFILIFLSLSTANDQQTIDDDSINNQFKNEKNQQNSLKENEANLNGLDFKIRKQRNIKKELNHQNHHFHNNYYSSIVSKYRSSDSSNYLNEQSYIPYRSLHNHSILTSSLSTSSLTGDSLTSSNLLQQQSLSRNKLNHLASIQGPNFQQELPAKISFSNNSGLVLNCAATGQSPISMF